jgi:hypothetical protein
MNSAIVPAHWFRTAIAGLIVVMLGFPQALIATHSSTIAPSMSLYVRLERSTEYAPLDPLTLEDMPGAEHLSWQGATVGNTASQPDSYPEFALSADGSTYVYLHTSDRAVEIYNGWDGPLRHSIPLTTQPFIANLSQDGRYLTLEEGMTGCDPTGCGPRILHTYDTITGELVSTITATDRNQGWPNMFAPDGTRLYAPVYAIPGNALATQSPGPWPLAIVSYDLLIGEETTRLPVPPVVGGSWPGNPIDGMYVGLHEDPALALSPDGSSIALIDSGMETLVTIDTGNMSIRSVQSINQPTSLFTDVLTWLGVNPRTAEAKAGEGRTLNARWSADGQSLFVTAYETTLNESTASISGSGFGLTRIDASTGDILAHALDGQNIDGYTLLVAPDGTSLYAMAETIPWWRRGAEETQYVIYRLDPESLDILAERNFATWLQLKLLAIER